MSYIYKMDIYIYICMDALTDTQEEISSLSI